MKKILFLILSILLISLLLTGCIDQITESTNTNDTLTTVTTNDLNNLKDLIAAEEEKAEKIEIPDTSTANLSSNSDTTYASYVKFFRTEEVKTNVTNIDADKENGTVKVDVVIPAEAKLYDSDVNLIKTKDATLSGNCIYNLKKENEQWKVKSRQIILSTKESKLTIESPTITPQPVTSGGVIDQISVNITGVDLAKIGALARIRIGKVGSRRNLFDYNGETFTISSCEIETVEPGVYPGLIKAVVWGSVRNVDAPIQCNIRNFNIKVE